MKLAKNVEKERDEIIDKLKAAETALSEAVVKYNETMTEAFAPLATARDTYNAAVDEAREWAGNVASELRGEIEEKSERWRESDKGTDAESMAEEWEGYDPENVEMEEPEDIEDPVETLAPGDDLEALPTSTE